MRRRAGLAIAALALLAPAAPAGAAECANATLALTAASAPKVEAALRCLVNQERAERGRKALTSNSTLNKLARNHTKDMAKRGYFSHTTPSGRTARQRLNASSYKGTYVAENIGTGATTAEAVIAVWMKSTQHRQNILSSKATDIGAGADGSSGRPLYTLVFGKRSS